MLRLFRIVAVGAISFAAIVLLQISQMPELKPGQPVAEIRASPSQASLTTEVPPANEPSTASAVENASPDASNLEIQVANLLTERCEQCHSGDDREATGQRFDTTDLTTFSDVIVPGKPDESLLLSVIRDGSMPDEQSGLKPLNAEEIALVENWVTGQASKRTTVTLSDELERVIEDQSGLLDAKEDLNRFLYVSLRHAMNREDISDERLEMMRFGFAKLINSLHWRPELIIPDVLDRQRTLYRIDMDELGWDRDAVAEWLDQYPYRAIPASETDSETRRAARRLVRADWLVDRLSSSSFYHQFLMDTARTIVHGNNEPFKTLDGLLGILQVDYESQFDSGRIQRAFINKGKGTLGSEVSDNYRVVDRLIGILGPVWISHDFQFNNDDQDIKQRPWGPPSTRREDRMSFHQNGGEVIFQLPNGLHAYLIVDADGIRIDEAPTSIVREPFISQSPKRQLAISTGVSCFRCHQGGYRSRSTISPKLFPNVIAKDRRPEVMTDETFAEWAGTDNVRYSKAMSTLVQSVTDAKVLSNRQEPITEIVRLYNQPLRQSHLAMEFEQFENTSESNVLQTIAATLRDELSLMVGVGEPKLLDIIKNAVEDVSASGSIERRDLEMIYSNLLFQFQLMEPS